MSAWRRAETPTESRPHAASTHAWIARMNRTMTGWGGLRVWKIVEGFGGRCDGERGSRPRQVPASGATPLIVPTSRATPTPVIVRLVRAIHERAAKGGNANRKSSPPGINVAWIARMNRTMTGRGGLRVWKIVEGFGGKRATANADPVHAMVSAARPRLDTRYTTRQSIATRWLTRVPSRAKTRPGLKPDRACCNAIGVLAPIT